MHYRIIKPRMSRKPCLRIIRYLGSTHSLAVNIDVIGGSRTCPIIVDVDRFAERRPHDQRLTDATTNPNAQNVVRASSTDRGYYYTRTIPVAANCKEFRVLWK